MKTVCFFLVSGLLIFKLANTSDIDNDAAILFSQAIECDQNGDEENAFLFYQEASSLGHIGAKHDLAFCYIDGFGVHADQQKGLELLRECADQGWPRAMTALAIFASRSNKSAQSTYWQCMAAFQSLDQNEDRDTILSARKTLYEIISDDLGNSLYNSSTISIITPALNIPNIILDHQTRTAVPAVPPQIIE